MQRIAIFAALRWECRPILTQLHQVSRDRVGTFTAWHATTADRTVCLIKTGIGVERAAAATQAAVAAGPFDLFLSTGCAGALAPELRPGDLAIATCVIANSTGQRFETDAPARAAAQHAGEHAALRVTQAPVLCSPHALATRESKRTAARQTGAVAVEMEGAAIAAAAAQAGVPFASVRTILDTADMELADAATFLDPDTGAVKPLALARYLTRHPTAVMPLLAMQPMMHAAQHSLDRFFRAFLADP